MNIYLAGAFARREELARYAVLLESRGHICTSRWLVGQENGDDAQWASEDLEDIRRADALVSFTEPESVEYFSGGRHVEFGYALAMDLDLYLVGRRENVFHCLVADDHQFDDFATCLSYLSKEDYRDERPELFG